MGVFWSRLPCTRQPPENGMQLQDSGRKEPEEWLEIDPDAQFESVVERRFMVRAVHPVTKEKLRAQLIRRNVHLDPYNKEDAEYFSADEAGHLIRWARHWLKEPGSDMIVTAFDMEDVDSTPAARFNHYLSFVQTVGLPGVEYDEGEDVSCQDSAEQWHLARIVGKEANYYFVQYKDHQDMPAEWVHKYSTRLRKLQKYEGLHASETPWDTFFELDWVRARHPTTNTYLPAKIITKDRKDKHMVILYEDPALLVRQEVVTQLQLERDHKKIESYSNWQRRWRYNRLFVYGKALKAVGLTIHPMSAEKGHSLYRALSHQLFGTDNNYMHLRLQCLSHIQKHKDYFQHFVDINFEYYIAHKKKGLQGEFFSVGDHLDIQAVCEMYDARCEVYSELSPRPLDTVRFYQQLDTLPVLCLSYRGANHYDSISHTDAPLPLTVERDLVRVPLGSHLTQRHLVLTARQEHQKKVLANQKLTQIKVTTETLYCKVMGCVQLGSNEWQLLKTLCEDLNLDLPETSSRPMKPTDFGTYSSSTVQLRLSYPARPVIDQSCPTMVIEGSKLYVDQAVRRVARLEPPRQELRVVTVGSRVMHKLGEGFRGQLKRTLGP